MASVFGYEVRSDRPLRRLRGAHGPRGTITVSLTGPSILDETAEITAIDAVELPSGEMLALVGGRGRDAHLIGCSATGGYRFDPRTLHVEASPLGDPEVWEHRLLSGIFPIMLASRGDLALHACVVDVGGRAVIFCGPPTRGKSTLALAFARLGHKILSEDGALIERTSGGWTVWPGAGGVRIRRSGDPHRPSVKVVTNLPGPEAGPLTPAVVVSLSERGGDGRPIALTRSSALIELAPHLMHAGGLAAVRPAFSDLATLLGEVPSFSVSLPDDLACLPEMAERLGAELLDFLPPRLLH